MTSQQPENPDQAAGETAQQLASLEEAELTIEKIVAGGEGLARWFGAAILVRGVAAGDRVRVRVRERHPTWARAELLEVIERGPGRRAAPCPYYDRCGGCDMQHLDEETQVQAKVDAAREAIERLGGIEIKDCQVIKGDRWAFRRRAQFQIAPSEDGPPRVGYYARGTHEVVPVDRCPILVPELDELLERLPVLLPENPPRRLDVAAADDGRVACAPLVGDLPGGELSLAASGNLLRFDARCFTQGHRQLTPELVRVAVPDRAEGEPPYEVAYDLFAGVGLFASALAPQTKRLIAVEGDRVAATWARRNLKRHRHATVVHQRAERYAKQLEAGADLVLVDPPRSGLPRPLRRALRSRSPRHLTYVSCHAATLARDLKEFGDRFRVLSVTFLDLFPQTSHLETVVHLERVQRLAVE